MSDWKKAMQLMLEGKKVRLSDWCKDEYITTKNKSYNYAVINQDGKKSDFSLSWFRSNDWELYEEVYDWNLNEVAIRNGEIEIMDIIKLKEKILEDLKNENIDTFTILDIKKILDNGFGF